MLGHLPSPVFRGFLDGIWGFLKMGVPKMDGFGTEHPTKIWMMTGGTPFQETSMWVQNGQNLWKCMIQLYQLWDMDGH